MAAVNGVAMYSETDPKSSQALVQQYAGLVKKIATHLMGRLPPCVQLDDLIQSGMIGLLEAAKKYDASKGASFETYAGIRIRGSMLDEIRRGDWAPRSVHRNSRRVLDAIKQVEGQTGRDAQDHEVAKELGISVDEYHSYLQDSVGSKLFSFEELIAEGDYQQDDIHGTTPGPFDDVAKQRFRRKLTDAITRLPERERLTLALYYNEELNLKEIGEILGVSESRVSQIHSQAAHRLKSRLLEWNDETA